MKKLAFKHTAAAASVPAVILPVDPTRLHDFKPVGSRVTYKLRVPDYIFQADVESHTATMFLQMPTEADLNAVTCDAARDFVQSEGLKDVLDVLGAYAAFLDDPDSLPKDQADSLSREARNIRLQLAAHAPALHEILRARTAMQAALTYYRVQRYLAGWANGPADFATDENGMPTVSTMALIPPGHVRDISARIEGLVNPTDTQIKN